MVLKIPVAKDAVGFCMRFFVELVLQDYETCSSAARKKMT
jgi:hypothetical protein